MRASRLRSNRHRRTLIDTSGRFVGGKRVDTAKHEATAAMPEASTATLDERGQVTLPEAVRDHLALHAGDEVEFVQNDSGFLVRKRPIQSPFAAWRGRWSHMAGVDPDEFLAEMRGR